MRKSLFVFLITFLICISINTCNAYTSDIDAYYISSGDNFFNTPSNYFDGENLFSIVHYSTVDSAYKVGIFSDYYADSGVNLIVAHDSAWYIYACVIDSEGYLYYATNYGVYKSPYRNSNTPHYTNDSEMIVISASATDVSCMRVFGDYVYFVEHGTEIKRFSTTNLLVSTYDTWSNNIYSFDFDTNGDIYAYGGSGTTDYIYKNDAVWVTPTTGYAGDNSYIGIQVTENYVYYGADMYSALDQYYANYQYYKSNATFKDTWNFENYAAFTDPNREFCSAFWIGSQTTTAACVYGFEYISIVETEETGLSTTTGGTSEYSYLQANIDVLYDTYYNDSSIDVLYNIKTDALNISDAYTFKQNTYYRIDLISPSGISIDTQFIQASTFSEELITAAGIIIISSDSYYYKTGNIEFTNSNNWENGTYTTKLYEVNRVSVSNVLLDTDTFTVLDYENPNAIGTDTNTDLDTQTLEERVDTLLNSKILIALIVIGAMAGLAKKSDGGYSATGLIIVIPLGIVAAVIMGLIDTWVLFLMFFVIVAAILFGRGRE